jgi:hypothetical protein
MKKTLNERLDLIKPKILSKPFREGTGLGNEINFWVFDYDAKDEMAVRAHIRYLQESIAAERDDARLVVFDLFDMMVDYLAGRGYLDKTFAMEKVKGSGQIIYPIKATLGLTEDENDEIISRISENNNPKTDIIAICGVGKAWPVIRSHTILNNLLSRVENTPLIMFFPGVYDSELRLFGEITDDNYYRAFRLIER